MAHAAARVAGRHFLQIPGPTPIPDRILRAMDMPIIDQRGPDFQKLNKRVRDGMKTILRCCGPVVIYPASGAGAWEAALANLLSPGDQSLMFETGHFAALWSRMALRLGLATELIASDWRAGADPDAIETRLRRDRDRRIRAVCVVHNETSTGCVTHVPEVRAAIDAAGHPAPLMVDSISSLGAIDYRHDEWGVDVTVAGSQKGLMPPPGLSFNALSEKAVARSKRSALPKSYWSWDEMALHDADGYFPYAPTTNLLYGLAEAIDMLTEKGLSNVFARHDRHAEATRRAVRGWGLEIVCGRPKSHSSSLTAVLLPEGCDADAFRRTALALFDISLGTGLRKLAGRVFRIGHLGDMNDLTILGTLAGVEMGLALAGAPFSKGGVQAAMDYLAACAARPEAPARTAMEGARP